MASEYRQEQENDELRRTLQQTQRQLAQTKARTEDLVAATHDAARAAMLAMGPVKSVATRRVLSGKGQPEVALWHMTDWQGAKRTTTYNSEVMRRRVMQFCEKAETITNIQRKHHPVDECVIAFGGDMVEGLFNFPSQAHEIDATLFEQYVTVSRLIMDAVRYACAVYEKVTVVAEWGNHGRIGSKRDGVPRHDNIDRMCYELARQTLAEQPNLTWEDCPEDVQRIEVGQYRAIVLHGDEVGRNGFASPGTLTQHIARWQSGAYPWPFRDAYVGHYHTHAEWALPNGLGSVYQTGSTESDNRYAGVMLAASATPSQRLHFIDPERGRVTSVYKVWLD